MTVISCSGCKTFLAFTHEASGEGRHLPYCWCGMCWTDQEKIDYMNNEAS